jgi:hypothetical protein
MELGGLEPPTSWVRSAPISVVTGLRGLVCVGLGDLGSARFAPFGSTAGSTSSVNLDNAPRKGRGRAVPLEGTKGEAVVGDLGREGAERLLFGREHSFGCSCCFEQPAGSPEPMLRVGVSIDSVDLGAAARTENYAARAAARFVLAKLWWYIYGS